MSFKTPMRSVPFISALATAQGSTAKPSTICKRRFIVSSRTDVTTPADAILAFFALLVRGQPTAIMLSLTTIFVKLPALVQTGHRTTAPRQSYKSDENLISWASYCGWIDACAARRHVKVSYRFNNEPRQNIAPCTVRRRSLIFLRQYVALIFA